VTTILFISFFFPAITVVLVLETWRWAANVERRIVVMEWEMQLQQFPNGNADFPPRLPVPPAALSDSGR
jgi:hypothetical protein